MGARPRHPEADLHQGRHRPAAPARGPARPHPRRRRGVVRVVHGGRRTGRAAHRRPRDPPRRAVRRRRSARRRPPRGGGIGDLDRGDRAAVAAHPAARSRGRTRRGDADAHRRGAPARDDHGPGRHREEPAGGRRRPRGGGRVPRRHRVRRPRAGGGPGPGDPGDRARTRDQGHGRATARGEGRDRTGRPSHAAGPRQRRAGRRRRPGAQCAARGHLGLGARHEPDPAADRRRAERRPRPASRGGGGRPVRGAGSGGQARLRGDRRERGIRRRDLRCARRRAARSSSSRPPVRGS